MELDFEHYKNNYKIHTGLVEDLLHKNKELEDMTEEHDKLKKWVEEQESAARPSEDDTEEEKTISTRAHLISRVRELVHDCLDTLGARFKAAVEQLKVVNPEVDLVTMGTNPLFNLVDGEIVIPEGFVNEEEEEEDIEA